MTTDYIKKKIEAKARRGNFHTGLFIMNLEERFGRYFAKNEIRDIVISIVGEKKIKIPFYLGN